MLVKIGNLFSKVIVGEIQNTGQNHFILDVI